jgi:hypothetical protein
VIPTYPHTAKPVSLETIDQQLADWRATIDAVSQNLLDLQNQASYQRLAGEAGFPAPQLTGQTAAQVQPALEAMNSLFQHFDLLADTISKAQSLRQQIGFFGSQNEKILEITQLLSSESIQLPIVEIPLAQRSLLSATHNSNRITPNDLLMVMVKSFEAARDVVLTVDLAWQSLEAQLAQSFRQIQDIQNQARGLEIPAFAELSQADKALAALHDRVDRDPLGVADEFAAITPLIQRSQASLHQIGQQRQQVTTGITQAAQQIQNLRSQQAQALEQYQEACAKTQGQPLQVPLDPSTLEALDDWQQTLSTKLANGLVNPLVVGLQNWQVKYEAARSITEEAIATATQALNLRAELRGRLQVLQAKAQARGKIEDPDLVAFAAQSQQILFSRPSNLPQANQVLIQYERRLNELLRSC